MEAKIEEDNDNVFRFVLRKATSGDANALRRAIMSKVECFAIDKVTFYENSSVMFDEYVAHRIGLIPITTPNKHGKEDEVLFTLEATGPGVVYSRQLKSSDKEVQVANGDIPIIKLAADQQLRIDAKAKLGTAFTHAKYQAGLASFEQKEEGVFEFYVESFGQIPPKELAHKAIEAIKDEVKEIKKDVKK